MASSQKWRTFFRQCLMNRIDVCEFRELSKLLFTRHPIAEAALIDELLESQNATDAKWDPLLPLYIDVLSKTGRVKASTVLDSLLRHSSIREKPSSELQAKKRKRYTLMTDVKVIQDVMLSVSTGSIPKSLTEAANLLSAVVDWIQAVLAWNNGRVDDIQQNSGLLESPDTVSLFESLGILLAVLAGGGKGLELLSANSHEALKIKLGQALSAYLPACVQISLPLRSRLDSLQKEFNLYGEQARKSLDSMMDGVNVNALQFEATVMDGPVINSRAGLYVYINAMLVGRPLVDDSVVINYLTNRYAGQYEVLIEELITASFDVLSNGMYRNESGRTMFLFRSFLVNKLPSFFAAMSAAAMVPLPMELCISQALNRLDPNAFPSFSQMFSMQGNSVLSDVRQDFLFACASHRLIPESSIERLLGENPMQTLPVGGPYLKDDIASQINSNHERAEQLIGELEKMEGNAGAIAGAIIDVIHHLCNHKESMTLKNICNALSRRPQALDVILLFRSTRQILQPLCALLDSWRWDDDQSENQPVYDEFGNILLLVLAFKHRYDLQPYDLGISSSDSFVLKLLDHGSCSQKLEDLNEKQNKNLGAWIGALFIAEGISEETMSACSPQEFYLLVTTLFNQSLSACEAGKLEFDTLKGGFEYLLEPFLLPSLVIALGWLGNHIWESENDPTIPLKTLQALVSPSSISGEAEAMHRTVLNLTARSLEGQLKDVRKHHPSRTDIKPILDALEPYLSFQRLGNCHRSELEGWTSHSGGAGGLLGSIRSTFQSLVLWSQNPEITMAPHSYTHRQLLAGIRMLGSTRVLAALIEETKLLTDAGSGDLALDVAATMVCAPMAESFAVDQNTYQPVDPSKEPIPQSSILTLRDALALQHENVSKIAEKDPLRAEVLVRLYRRVNSLSAPSAHVHNLDISSIVQNMQLGAGGPGQMEMEQTGAGAGDGGAGEVDAVGEDDRENINQMLDDAAAAAAAGIDSGVGQDMGLDTTGMGMGMGMEMGMGMGMGMDTSIDDVLNAADMAVGNPEFLDLDMEGML